MKGPMLSKSHPILLNPYPSCYQLISKINFGSKQKTNKAIKMICRSSHNIDKVFFKATCRQGHIFEQIFFK